MQYIQYYSSPLGKILLTSDGEALTGLWFEGGKYVPGFSSASACSLPVFDETSRWLDIYFTGRQPDFMPPVKFPEASSFRREVWEILRGIPYGTTVTYGEIASMLAARRGIPMMSSRAVGGAVGHNPVGIIVPCHRVMGSDGSLTGYAGGLDRKIRLLELEGLKVRYDSLSVIS